MVLPPSGAPEAVCILGGGSFGSACLRIVADSVAQKPELFQPRVTWWIRREALAAKIRAERVNPEYLPGCRIPENVDVLSELSAALKDAQVLVFATPYDGLPEMLPLVKAALGEKRASQVRALHLVKSLVLEEDGPNKPPRLTWAGDKIEEGLGLPSGSCCALAGGNIYTEMGRDEPAEATIGFGPGAKARNDAEVFRQLFTLPGRFVVDEVSDDVWGVQACGALKNVVSVATGFVEGLDLGFNARAIALRVGLSEMRKFCLAHGKARGFKPETLLTACGVGDLVLTCNAGRGRKLSGAWVKAGEKPGTWDELQNKVLGGMKIPDLKNAEKTQRFLKAHGAKPEDYPMFMSVHEVAAGRMSARDFVAGLAGGPLQHAPPPPGKPPGAGGMRSIGLVASVLTAIVVGGLLFSKKGTTGKETVLR